MHVSADRGHRGTRVALAVAVLASLVGCGQDRTAAEQGDLIRQVTAIVRMCEDGMQTSEQPRLAARVRRVIEMTEKAPRERFPFPKGDEEIVAVDQLAYVVEVLAGLDAGPRCSPSLARQADDALRDLGEESVLAADV